MTAAILKTVLVVAVCVGAAVGVNARVHFGGMPPQYTISTLTFGTPFKYSSRYSAHTVNADGMSNTWADDDNIYINLDDTLAGFDQAVSGGANTMIGKMTTYDTAGIGSNWNTMVGGWGAYNTCTSADNSSHKIAGIISLQTLTGGMYAWAWRLSCATTSTGGNNAQLLKSTDHGASWNPVPPSGALAYTAPMFPGNPMPMGWIQYGKDYSLAGPDNSSTYVYAMVIDDGVSVNSRQDEWLGRCRITNIANQSAADWTFWKGGDGMVDSNWGTLAQARATGSLVHVAGNPGDTTVYYWNVVWLPAYQQYLAINDASVPTNQTWTPYVAPHPWGPWRALPGTPWGSSSAIPIGTFPNPVTKSLSVDGGHTMYVYGSGDNTSQAANGGNYTLWIIPATVN